MNFLKGRLLAIIVLAFAGAMFIGLLIAGRVFGLRFLLYMTPSSLIEGEYSVDDGPWKEIDYHEPINERFQKIIFKGKLIETYDVIDEIDMSIMNLWFTLKTGDGEIIFGNDYRTMESEALTAYFQKGYSYSDEEAQEMLDFFKNYMPVAMFLPKTPGFEHITFIPKDILNDFGNTEMILTFENPYRSHNTFSELVTFTLSSGNGTFVRALWMALLQSTLFLLVCFFGLFLFPTISFVFGKIHYRYLSFGFLCFFWAAFRIVHLQAWFLSSIISDPVVCMMLYTLTIYIFFASLIIYFRANLHQDISRIVSGAAAIIFLLVVLAAVILQFTVKWDLIVTEPYIQLLMAVILVILVFLLAREARTDRNALRHLLSWTPMALTLFLDILNQFISFGKINFFIYGFSVTLALQIVQLVFDLQRQYKAALHYEQVRRELYEAKVSIMTSQIRPHFMYNALTSIAMMCTIDPPTAQEATVTFAKYLRENMDSLKQNKPVPFNQELDHLKKYLYIEKLRFQDKLNVEYDITVTDFVLPLLSVQPLVENAVKHGVGMKKKGGTVKISTRETDSAYEVIVSDDGVGFDTTAPKADDGRSHVGMENTRTRLKEMCGGYVKIESTVGEGTVATIILSKDKQSI